MENDLISRHAAIELIERMKPYHQEADDIAEMIANMPSAQPEKVKCKKCRYVYYDKEFGNYWCNRMSGSFMVEEDGYCKWGK